MVCKFFSKKMSKAIFVLQQYAHSHVIVLSLIWQQQKSLLRKCFLLIAFFGPTRINILKASAL
jgi:hypothetical protein